MASIFGRLKTRNRTSSSNSKVSNEESNDNAKLEPRNLAFASGFVTLHERIKNLALKKSRLEEDEEDSSKTELVAQKQRAQYATLQELFSSRSNSVGGRWHHQHQQPLQPKKPKIPIMKLSKEDWNVKCWEERLARRRHESSRSGKLEPNRPTKPERQVEVFQDRIEDVAVKLEKVREGAPQDETLYQLSLNKGGASFGKTLAKGSHEWTDLLKNELENRVHSHAKLAGVGKHQAKSPLGRPIRHIYQEEEEED